VVEIRLVDGQIIVTPVETPTWTLDELLAGIDEENIHHEADTGPAVGNEIW
jgi:antitoxin component of MazEF toxin-antitoxin module